MLITSKKGTNETLKNPEITLFCIFFLFSDTFFKDFFVFSIF